MISSELPIKQLTTDLSWDDLGVSRETLSQIQEIETWSRKNNKFADSWGRALKTDVGYRALFHGPSGTGKTLTASLLGKYSEKDVYSIDLSMVVSKFIGETEKNLSALFDKAEENDWILFFDEADAIIGRRTCIRDVHDKYANQEVSYLLQRMELYKGLIILAANKKDLLGETIIRRMKAIIYFPNTKPE